MKTRIIWPLFFIIFAGHMVVFNAAGQWWAYVAITGLLGLAYLTGTIHGYSQCQRDNRGERESWQ